MGTWTFHGTGFAATPFIYRTVQGELGNQQWALRGAREVDGSVQALPLWGLGAIVAGIVAYRLSKR